MEMRAYNSQYQPFYKELEIYGKYRKKINFHLFALLMNKRKGYEILILKIR
jgi:formyltetrahydrofolate synthetase